MNKLVIFALLMIGQLFCAFAMSLLQPFFPPYAAKKDISPLLVGVIFSANPVGAIIASLFLGKVLNDNNKYVFMCLGTLFQSVGLYLFAATYYQERVWIIITGVIARFINGFGQSAFMTPMYAFIPRLFPDSMVQKLSFAEISLSTGFLLAPVLGSSLYSLGGYNLPFYVFGTFSLIFVPIMGVSFNKLNKSISYIQHIEDQVVDDSKKQLKESLVKEESSRHLNQSNKLSRQSSFELLDPPKAQKFMSVSQQIDDLDHRLSELNEKDYNKSLMQKPLNYSEVVCSYAVCMTTLCGFCLSFMFNFVSPINANYLEQQYNLPPDYIGYCQVSVSLFFIFGAIIAGRIKKHQKLWVFGAGIILGISAVFTGPDTEIVQIDKQLYITLLGLTIMGGVAPFLVIFNIPLLNGLLNQRFRSSPIQCANMSAALYTCGTYLGELLGPITGGLLTQQYGYPRAVTFMGCTVIFICLLYIPVIFREERVEESKIEIIFIES